MAGALTDLGVAGRLAARAVGRRLRSDIEPPPDLDKFTADMEALLAQAPPSTVKEFHWVTVPATQPPWLGSGIQLESGEEVSLFVAGRVYANRLLDVYVPNSVQLWFKVGAEGEIFRGTRDSHSFSPAAAGELMIGNYFPNDWADTRGARKQSDSVYKAVSGELKVLVIRWTGTAAEGLRALAAEAAVGNRLQSELARIDAGDSTPEGWQYLWHLGPAEIYQYSPSTDGNRGMRCRTCGDVGILQKDVDLPLTESSEISWRWCVEQLPSTVREDSVPSHDYLSIAVEFDDGRDITYYWSSNLPVGTGYDCPLPNWAGIEYHVAIRSGSEGLGQWHSERRNLHADYRHYMGDPPSRIVRVWLIANSIFQRGEGVCEYADIVLHENEQQLRVL